MKEPWLIMNNSNRVIINTLSQYIRTILNVVLALYSTKIILSALGTVDYGLYSVIAGSVAMLSFMTNALIISTQRYLSYYHGQKNINLVSRIFCNSLLIHCLIGICLFIILLFLRDFVLTRLLDIPIDKETTTIVIYSIVAGMVSISFITSPFRALFIARENIVYISIIDILDGLFKVIGAVCLTYYLYNRLILYGIILGCISIFNLLAFSLYAWKKYEECVLPSASRIDKLLLKQIFSFSNWTIYGSGCVTLRTQGIAIIINRFFGVALNASFGIAQQIGGALANASQAIANALSPQIIKAEGEGNRTRMLKLAGLECKYSFLMLIIVSIPAIYEMPLILNMWLGEVSATTTMFVRLMVIACLCDQLTAGLGIANQAIGKIRSYSLLFGTTKILTIPIALIFLQFIDTPTIIMISYVGLELLASILRLFFLKSTANLDVKTFTILYILPSCISATLSIIVCGVIQQAIDEKYRILFMYIISGIMVLIINYMFMNQSEKNVLKICVKRLIKR